MKSQAHGRKTHKGITHPLSGFLYCADCGGKLKMGYVWAKKIIDITLIVDDINAMGKLIAFHILSNLTP